VTDEIVGEGEQPDGLAAGLFKSLTISRSVVLAATHSDIRTLVMGKS